MHLLNVGFGMDLMIDLVLSALGKVVMVVNGEKSLPLFPGSF